MGVAQASRDGELGPPCPGRGVERRAGGGCGVRNLRWRGWLSGSFLAKELLKPLAPGKKAPT